MENINYTGHLLFRMKMRGIPEALPLYIYKTSKERYFDSLTLHNVVVKKVKFQGKTREMAVVYEKSATAVNLITIHPLKLFQKISRLQLKRWQKI